MCHAANYGILVVMTIFLVDIAFCHGPKTHVPDGNIMHDSKVVRDKDHIQEHYEGKAKIKTDKMTDEELEWHYFKLHDLDNNTKLDGLEIFSALRHMLPYEETDKHKKPDLSGKTADEVKKIIDDLKDEETKYYTDIIDTVLKEDDLDNDGYLTYLEYVIARRREQRENEQHKKNK